MRADSGHDVVLDDACRIAGLDAEGAHVLRAHATVVYLLPRSGIVARIGPRGGPVAPVRRAVQMTGWLIGQGFPATAPADVAAQPIEIDDLVVSFWIYLPQPAGSAPSTADLGRLLRRLHLLPAPPLDLPPFRPLTGFGRLIEQADSLPPSDRRWLADERDRLLTAYAELDSPLGHGHLHGDAYPGNLISSAHGPVLGDWDETAIGPREIDLANTYQGVRFGRTDAELRAFAAAYGYDLRDWPGLPTLTAIRDLHTLGSYIRRADSGDVHAGAELSRRVDSLRRQDRTARWLPT